MQTNIILRDLYRLSCLRPVKLHGIARTYGTLGENFYCVFILLCNMLHHVDNPRCCSRVFSPLYCKRLSTFGLLQSLPLVFN